MLPAGYPTLPKESKIRTIPPAILEAVGWVESGWRQFTASGRPLLSFDFGYGIMQVTSGMDGAFGKLHGEIDPAAQSQIASSYLYNIAYGAKILAQKWAAAPRIGNGDPTVLEDWYYALWAYNGWGYVNNPNNPRFSRIGTPASDPNTYPYQERVLYLVSHPPTDAYGNPLWKPMKVSLPSRSLIGATPHAYTPKTLHRDPVSTTAAVYEPKPLLDVAPGATQKVKVRLINTGTQPWLSQGIAQVSLTYHLFTTDGDPWSTFSPFTAGVIAYGQGATPLPHDVLPARSITMTIPVKAPAKTGTYRVAFDLQQGAGVWFSQGMTLPRVEALHVVAAPTPPSANSSPTPVPKPPSQNRLLFVQDTSIPDGSSVLPGATFEKGWLVFNAGKSTWGAGWGLSLVSGKSFGAKRISVPATKPCNALDLIGLLKAPTKPGHYVSVWQMKTASGTSFGDKLTVVVNVGGAHTGPTPTPVETDTPTPTPVKPKVTATPTPVG